jgi:hypothetical protein
MDDELFELISQLTKDELVSITLSSTIKFSPSYRVLWLSAAFEAVKERHESDSRDYIPGIVCWLHSGDGH